MLPHWCIRNNTEMKLKSGFTQVSHCMALVRKHDYEHYLCTLLLPKSVQPVVFALRSYNIEVALIKDTVSEVAIGKMKLTFWRDAINTIFKKGSNDKLPDHLVVNLLAQAVKECNLNKIWLSRLLDARETDLTRTSYHQTKELEDYCENTSSSLFYLTLEALGIKDVHSDHVASHIGKAQGIVTLLRAAGYYRSKRQVLIPLDILMRHGSSQEEFLRGEATPSLINSTYDLASLANAHLLKAISLADKIPKGAAARVFLPAVATRSFLEDLERVDFNPYSERLRLRRPSLPMTLLWKAFRNKYY